MMLFVYKTVRSLYLTLIGIRRFTVNPDILLGSTGPANVFTILRNFKLHNLIPQISKKKKNHSIVLTLVLLYWTSANIN